MIAIRHERPSDMKAREALLDEALGQSRYQKSSERLREGRLPAHGLSFVVTQGKRVVGTARLWNITCGPATPALLLGPLAVAEECRNRGVGGMLVAHAIFEARKLGHDAIVLVGDALYYSRFGFTVEPTSALWMPGPFERNRLLGIELKSGSLKGARGLIRAAGQKWPTNAGGAAVPRAA